MRAKIRTDICSYVCLDMNCLSQVLVVHAGIPPSLMVFDYFSWHPNSLCDSCSRTEDEYEVFIVVVLAEDINCHPGQSGKVPLYWQFPPEPHIYISGKSDSSC